MPESTAARTINLDADRHIYLEVAEGEDLQVPLHLKRGRTSWDLSDATEVHVEFSYGGRFVHEEAWTAQRTGEDWANGIILLNVDANVTLQRTGTFKVVVAVSFAASLERVVDPSFIEVKPGSRPVARAVAGGIAPNINAGGSFDATMTGGVSAGTTLGGRIEDLGDTEIGRGIDVVPAAGGTMPVTRGVSSDLTVAPNVGGDMPRNV